MARIYACSPVGGRAFFPKPVSKGERISAIGTIGYNGLVFQYYVEIFWLMICSPGKKVVIMDNASSHKRAWA